MKYIIKLKTYNEIKNVINKGEKFVLPYFVIYRFKLSEPSKKITLGILLSKKFGKAVKRNYGRRRIVAILNQINESVCKEYAYVFIPRQPLIAKEYANIKLNLEEFFKKLG